MKRCYQGEETPYEPFIRAQRRKIPEANVMPLINVVFLLLFFFMLADAGNQRGVLHVHLPKTNDATEPYVPQIEVSVAKDGRASVGSQVFASSEEAALSLQAAKKTAPPGHEPQINIRADANISAVALLPVIGAAKAAGYAEVHLVSLRNKER